MTLDADLAERALDARLVRKAGRPLAVAFSGGGDSLALLLIAKSWADRAGRPLIVLTVDHRQQAQSGDWAAWCASTAARLGAAHEILVWDGPKPARPAAARQARHRLIAGAARRAGASVVLFGHTADDVLESTFMQAAGVHISAPAAWSPSPVWPEGREIFIHRPLIGARRAAIRAWLSSQGETWIDDPANEDLRHPRARARAAMADVTVELIPANDDLDRPAARATIASPDPVVVPFPMSGLTPTFGASCGPSCEIILVEPIVSMMLDPRARDHYLLHLGAAAACASGGERPPRRDALERIVDRLAAGELVNSTLGGARVLRTKDQLTFAREIGDTRGRACRPLALRPGELQIWDGRFEVRAHAPGLTLAALRGHAAKLDKGQNERLAAFHPAVRAALPALIDGDGAIGCPTLTPDDRVEIKGLAFGRMLGATGAIDSEAKIGLYA